MIPIYVRDAHGIILVYDVMNRQSFESLERWLSVVSDNLSGPYVLGVVANKIDLRDSPANIMEPTANIIDTAAGQEFAMSKKAYFCEVSGQTGFGISELFTTMATEVFDSAQKQGVVPVPFAQIVSDEEKTPCC
jgi:GTPase SAR1 family protein